MRKFLTLLLFSFFLASPLLRSEETPLLPTSLPIPETNIPRVVQVALLVNVPKISFSTDGAFELLNRNGNVLSQGTGPLEASVIPQKEGIAINGTIYPTDQLVVKTPQKFIQIGKRQYRDQIRILKKSEKSLTVVNQVNLEEYLKGVLPLEAHPDWPTEALKAHAVISRTFALFKSIEKQNQEFSVKDTVESQVYGGALFHKKGTDDAISETKGEILTFQGKIFPTYFHANCGGRTTKPERIWPVRPNPVFQEVNCSFCKNTKHWKWSFEMSLRDIESIMQKQGYPAKNLKRISFSERDSSGRVSTVILNYQRSTLTRSAVDFRNFLGYDKLKSLKAWAETKNGKVYFHGLGWGHGVGFCQWGAKGQADQSKTYLEILKFYFPEAEIKRV